MSKNSPPNPHVLRQAAEACKFLSTPCANNPIPPLPEIARFSSDNYPLDYGRSRTTYAEVAKSPYGDTHVSLTQQDHNTTTRTKLTVTGNNIDIHTTSTSDKGRFTGSETCKKSGYDPSLAAKIDRNITHIIADGDVDPNEVKRLDNLANEASKRAKCNVR